MNRLNRICCTDYSGQRVQENFKTRFNKWLLIKRADVNERFVKKTSTFVHVCPQFGDWIILIGKSPRFTHPRTHKEDLSFQFYSNSCSKTLHAWTRFCCKMCQMLCFPSIINLVELNVSKVCCKSQWSDADFGRSPNNRCTLHQWEHPFQQSVPHMAPRPLLHALSRQRVSFMLLDSGSLRASWPSDQLFWSDLALWQRKTFLTHIY